MNYFKNLLLLSIALFAFSCSDDDDNTGGGSDECTFLSQEIQGEIEGIAFDLQGGSAELDTDDNTFDIDLFGMDEDFDGSTACDIFIGSEDRVFFGNLPAEVGEYSLTDITATDGLTVTLYSNVSNINVIATNGCVGITGITDTTVTIQFDIDYDANNSLNGTSMLELCQ